MNIWIVCLISIAAGLVVGMIIQALKDSTKLLEAELRAERAERKMDTDIAAAIIQNTEAGEKRQHDPASDIRRETDAAVQLSGALPFDTP